MISCKQVPDITNGSKLLCGTYAEYHYACILNYVITYRRLMRANHYDEPLCMRP